MPYHASPRLAPARSMPCTAALLLAVSCAAGSHAAVFNDPEGVSGTGTNDSLATATVLGVLPVGTDSLTANGYISDADANDVDFYQFTIAGGPVDVFFDIDLAEDINATDDDDTGLDAELWIFDSTGTLIARNDDSDFFEIGVDNLGTDSGSDPFADHDPFIGALNLGDGTYYAVVSYYANDANALSQGGIFGSALSFSGSAISGATPDSTFVLGQDPPSIDDQNFGTYQLDIRTTFAEVPEPGSLALLGLGALAVLRRRRPA